MNRTTIFGFVVLIAFFFSAPVIFARWQHEVFDTVISADEIRQSDKLDSAIGTDGTIHILYLKDEHKLPFNFDSRFYAYRDDAGWHSEDLTQLINRPPLPSLCLDSNNDVYISYANAPNLYLLTNASGSWVTEAIVSDEDGTLQTSKMIIDSHDYPHLFYFSFSDGHHYGYKDNTGWHDELLEEMVYLNADACDLDSNDDPHVVYAQEGEGGDCFLTYAYRDITGWHPEILNGDKKERCSINFSMALDSNDKAHVLFESYEDMTDRGHTFYYMTNASGSWVTESVVTSGYPPFIYPSAISIDANNTPHFSYHHVNPLNILATAKLRETSIWYAQRDVSGWNKKLVKRACTFEFYPWPYIKVGNSLDVPTMELDMNGNPHIFYLSTFYLYNSLLQFFPDSSFPGVTTYWNHIYFEP